MITVEFRSICTARCGWCQKEKEIFSVAFADDSFVGNLCWTDLRRALQMKVGVVGTPKAPASNSGPPILTPK